MRFGLWRGVTLAIALAAAFAMARPASAQFHVIPKYAPTIDYRTGQPMMAPPVPYGEYAKDYVGSVTGLPGACLGKLCGLCRGLGCGWCHNKGCGDPCGSCGGNGCGRCKGTGLGHGHGGGLFHHGDGCGDSACGGRLGHGRRGKHFGHHGGGEYVGVVPSAQEVAASPQAPSPQCGGCGGQGCGLCGGKGRLGHHGGGLCGDPGCGLGHHGGKACGDPGCDTCGKGGHGLCKGCGGKGCGLCRGLLGGVHSAVANVLHIGGVRYFVGPGGPVPITPGYVNYVVPVRSPRDFFAFPPFIDTER